ncbi:FG-GAP-like repeat-containing protein [Agitococcus lubricus]|nr:FG-GAP-like repeat-containing protein [Agitococcus lubricus]
MTILIGLSAWSIIASTAEIPASKLQGNFSVSPMGAATYSIPLSLPAGVNGATPKLSLEYNSQAGMGIAGMGWNIGGLSAITRCPQSKAVDGVQKALTFSPDDRFCMDGQRLILTSGTYGAAGSTYQTQINNFARVTALAHPNNTSLIYFKVDTKDGKVLEYGSRLDAVLQPNASGKANFPLVWMISRSEDRDQKGQLVEYDYTNDNVNGQQTLSRVRYAFDESDINNLVEVVFSYHTIPEIPTTEYPLPAIKRYIAGGATTKLNSQLAKITIRSASSSGQSLNEVINYQLRYEVASYTRRQRLKEIELCTSLANCMPPLKFQSSNPLNSIELAFSLPANKLNYFGQVAGGWTDNSSYPRQLVDVNGDGLPDIVGFASSGVMVALNNGQGGFNNAENKLAYFGITSGGWTDNNSYPRQLVDVNGDGLPDIVGFASSGVMVALNNGQGGFNNAENKLAYFGINAGGWTDNSSYPRQLVDVNGDGLPDIVGFASSGVMVALNKATGFESSILVLSEFGINQGWTSDYSRSLIDLNGDGKIDILGFSAQGVIISNYKDGFQFDLITQFDKTALLGTPYNITYLPITNNQIYVGGGQSAYPNYNLRFPMYVVSSVSTSNGVNGDNHNDYFYRGLTANQTRGWQGFLGTAVVNREQKTRRETIYNQSFPYTGMVKEQRTVYCTANCLTSHTTYPFVNQTGFDVLSTLINTFEYTTINGISSSQKIYFPYVKSSTVKTYEAPIVSQ